MFNDDTIWVREPLKGWKEYKLNTIENYKIIDGLLMKKFEIHFKDSKKVQLLRIVDPIELLEKHLDAQIEKNKNA